MKAAEIRKLKAEEIRNNLDEKRHELMNLRFNQVTGQLTDTTRFKITRRDIARFETILTERARQEKEGK